MQPIDPHLSEFLHDLDEVSGAREMHLEVMNGRLLAVDDRPGADPVPVEWDDTLKSYRVLEPS
jgi:hypothetical protein